MLWHWQIGEDFIRNCLRIEVIPLQVHILWANCQHVFERYLPSTWFWTGWFVLSFTWTPDVPLSACSRRVRGGSLKTGCGDMKTNAKFSFMTLSAMFSDIYHNLIWTSFLLSFGFFYIMSSLSEKHVKSVLGQTF